MNIHIDYKLAKSLFASTIFKTPFGSHLYKTNGSNSDVDMLCIYIPSKEELNSPFTNHHQFQWKDTNNNIDYVFTSLQQFIKNTLSGDSTINFEVIQSGVFGNTKLNSLHLFRDNFITHSVLKSYLGMAKRDLNKMYQYGSNDSDYNKSLSHAYRGFIFAQRLFNKDSILPIDPNDMYMLQSFKMFTKTERDNKRVELLGWIKDLRQKLNTSNFDRFPTKFVQSEINKSVLEVMDYYSLSQADSHIGLMRLVYKSNYKDIKY